MRYVQSSQVAAIGASFLYGVGANFARTKAAHISSMSVAAGTQVASALLLLPIAITPPMLMGCVVILLGSALATGLLRLPFAKRSRYSE